jgi:hypothetical protein
MLAGVTLLVTLLGLMLAVLGVALGLGAIFGYRGLVDEVVKRAEIAASKVTLEGIESKAIAAATQVATRVAEKSLEKLDLGVLLSAAQSEQPIPASNAQERVGENYPGDPGREAKNANRNNDPNAGANNPAAPKESAR